MHLSRPVRAATVVAASVLLAGTAAGTAQAKTASTTASGTTTFQLGGPVLKALQANGCGTLTGTALGDATVKTTGAGKFQANLAVTKIVYTTNDTFRVEHGTSGIVLGNSCYEVKFSGFYVQNLGGTRSTGTFDVLAKTRSVDESNRRQLNFTLDANGSTTTGKVQGGTVRTKTTSLDLLLAADGAAEFNELATGSEATGPFSAGQQIGKARITLRVPAGAITPAAAPPPANDPAPTSDPAPTGDPAPVSDPAPNGDGSGTPSGG